jgi:O-antigen/teichoic acid export membrane protein
MRRDLTSAYAAVAARYFSWLLITAFVYRRDGAGSFAVLSLVRATLGLLNYATVGLAPAMVHYLPKAQRRPVAVAMEEAAPVDLPDAAPGRETWSMQTLYCNGVALAWMAGIVSAILVVVYDHWFHRTHRSSADSSIESVGGFIGLMGMGMVLRLMSDPSGALLQIRGKIAFDNMLIAGSELFWCFLAIAGRADLHGVGMAFALSGVALVVTRGWAAHRLIGIAVPLVRELRPAVMRLLLTFGAMVTIAQVADFLYAPTDFILIDRLLTRIDVATYSPAVHIDAGLLLLVSALAAVILPKAAIAHAADDAAMLRRYYFRGTLASALLLTIAAGVVWGASPLIFRIWLGNSMPGTRSILPLVLLNTVLGGSAMVGRSILLAVGRVKPFTAAALIAGGANVLCSYGLVRFLHLGLRGIVLGTIVAVIGRCAIWMPWYVLKTLRETAAARPRLPSTRVSV